MGAANLPSDALQTHSPHSRRPTVRTAQAPQTHSPHSAGTADPQSAQRSLWAALDWLPWTCELPSEIDTQ